MVTAAGGSIVSTITSDGEALGTRVTSVGGSLVTEATNAAGSVVATATDAANTDTSNGGVAPTAAPVIAGGLLGAGVVMVAML